MGKCLAYSAAAITFMGIGALITGLSLYYVYPNMAKTHRYPSEALINKVLTAECQLAAPSEQHPVNGLITLEEDLSHGINITANVGGLTAGAHGFHIHEFGVQGRDCKTAGAHYNPTMNSHGAPNSTSRHVGDLGNIYAVEEGPQGGTTLAVVDLTDQLVKLSGAESVVGRSFVIHAKADDLGASGDQAGNAGIRVACCTIYRVPTPAQ